MLRRVLGHPLRYRLEAEVYKRRVKGWQSPNKTTFANDARPGEAAELFDVIRSAKGWFTYDDTAAFLLLLRSQTALGIQGDVFEIGCFFGRSACALVRGLAENESVLVCDPLNTHLSHETGLNAKAVRALVERANPNRADRFDLFVGYSQDLDLPTDRRFRFVHVDGDHDHGPALHDLRLARKHLMPGGVVVVDDYDHPDYPGVLTAVALFRAEHPELVEVADLNRHAESGRKLYLALPTAWQ